MDAKREVQEELKRIGEVEIIAESIFTDRQQLIDFDEKRQKNREALSALKKIDPSTDTMIIEEPTPKKKAEKVWICSGPFFIKMESSMVKNILTADQARINNEIEALRESIKTKVNQMQDLNGGRGSFGDSAQFMLDS